MEKIYMRLRLGYGLVCTVYNNPSVVRWWMWSIIPKPNATRNPLLFLTIWLGYMVGTLQCLGKNASLFLSGYCLLHLFNIYLRYTYSFTTTYCDCTTTTTTPKYYSYYVFCQRGKSKTRWKRMTIYGQEKWRDGDWL